MRFAQSATELTTSATDALLGGVCVIVALRLGATETAATWKRALLAWIFGLFAFASFLGALAHGFVLSQPVRSAIWSPLYLSLGVAVALFVVAAVYDWRGEASARRLLPWAAAVGCAFYAFVQLAGGSFLIFVAFEAVALIAAFVAYTGFAVRGRLAGAGLIAAGIGFSLVAAAIQATSLSTRLVVPLDHNGLFHLLQTVAVLVLADGVRRNLAAGKLN
jgi:uncharacterized protein DUF6962